MIPGNANPLLLATAADAAAAAVATKSLRFNDGDSAYLSRTPSSAGNRKTWTFSTWCKQATPGNAGIIFNSQNGTTQNFANNFWILFNANKLVIGDGSADFLYSQLLRDPSAWYHFVVACDTTQSSASDRLKIYINGVEADYTGDYRASNISQNSDTAVNATYLHRIGDSGSYHAYLDGYLTDTYLIDGSALDPTSFGAFDDSGVWQAIGYSGTYGTNGFHLLDFASESTVGHDSSGNENDFTANNFVAAAGALVSGGRSAAVSFDGVDDSIGYSNDSDLEPGTGNFTLECFVYRFTSEVVLYYGQSNGELGIRVSSAGGLGVERRNVAFDVSGAVGDVPDNQWSHVAVTRHAGTLRIYVNGSMIRSASNTQNYTGTFKTGQTPDPSFSKGAVADLHFVKGTALYTGSSYTVPTTISSHANTKLLCFQSASSATAATVKPSGVTISTSGSPTAGPFPQTEGKDVDVLFDVPTNGTQSDTGAGGEVSGNYATLNPLDSQNSLTLSNGNLDVSNTASSLRNSRATISYPATGKWYYEYTPGGSANMAIGIADSTTSLSAENSGTFVTYHQDGAKNVNGTKTASAFASYTAGDVIGVMYDSGSNSVTFYKNNSSQGSVTPTSGTTYFPFIITYNTTGSFNFGARAFAYTAPSSAKALCTTNLPTPTIADGSDYFNTLLWTGDGSTTRSLTGVGFNPDLLWFKSRDSGNDHNMIDAVRGANKTLIPNRTNTETTDPIHGYLTSFDSDGFSVTTGSFGVGDVNYLNRTYVGWAWDAGSSTVSNTDGDITTTLRANATAGFSTAIYSGSGTNGDRIGHGLGVEPDFCIIKARNKTDDWRVYHSALGTGKILALNSTSAASNASNWQSINSTTLGLQNDAAINGSGYNYVAYFFAAVAGYSAFGSYTGNGSSDGTFVALSFRPALVILKNTDNSSSSWKIYDNKRDPDNPISAQLYPNLTSTEISGARMDFLSNGFKLRTNGNEDNGSGNTFIYAAFSENAFSLNGGLAR